MVGVNDDSAQIRAALAGSPVTVWGQDRDLRYTWIFNTFMGLEPEHVVGRTDSELMNDSSIEALVSAKRRVIESGEPRRDVLRIASGDAAEIHDMHLRPVMDDDGAVVGLAGVSTNITGLARSATPLYRALKEMTQAERDGVNLENHAEMMVREAHHRVKNSLNLVAAFLRMQNRDLARGPSQEALAQAEARIVSIADTHDLLSRAPEIGVIDLERYLRELIVDLERTGAVPGGVTIDGAAETVEIPADQALHLGLVVTELLMNAIKHGVTTVDGTAPLRLGLGREGGLMRLTVADHGPGLPDDFDASADAGLGMRIVLSLVHGMGGALRTADGADGATFIVEAPLHQYRGDREGAEARPPAT